MPKKLLRFCKCICWNSRLLFSTFWSENSFDLPSSCLSHVSICLKHCNPTHQNNDTLPFSYHLLMPESSLEEKEMRRAGRGSNWASDCLIWRIAVGDVWSEYQSFRPIVTSTLIAHLGAFWQTSGSLLRWSTQPGPQNLNTRNTKWLPSLSLSHHFLILWW